MASETQSASTPVGETGGSLPLLAEIDRRCDEYEAAWLGGAAPECEAAVVDVEAPLIEPLLRELVLIEWQYRGGADDADAVRGAIGCRDALRKACRAASIDLDALLDEIARGAAHSQRQSVRGATLPFSAGGGVSNSGGALHLRCPHCQNGVELLPDAPLDDVTCNSCGSQFGILGSDADATAAPPKVARFVLEDRLGVGGFGAVWKARDPELDRRVALKLPRSGQLLPHEMELFLREARAAAQLAHPNIVPVHEVGRDGESVFIVSELIEGEPLSALLKEERPPIESAVDLLATIAEAVDYAHERGVIHRDLKPSNVMVDGAGRPFVMDFGLAKREVGEITMTIEGQVLGTPAYMSPEQASGQVRWVDRRTDVYALGVMLFQMLTGELPFRGTAQSQLNQRLSDDPPSPRRLDPNTPIDLATVCLKSLERDQNRRYATAGELADELRRWRRGEPVLARPLSTVGVALRWSRRHPALATAIALGAVLAVGGPTAAYVIYERGAQAQAEYEQKLAAVSRREAKIDSLNLEVDELRSIGPRRPAGYLGANLPTWRRQLITTLLTHREEDLVTAIAATEQGSIESARANLGLAYLYGAVGRLEDAVEPLSEAEAALTALSDSEEVDSEVNALLAECSTQFGETLMALDRAEEAAPRLARAAELRDELVRMAPASTEALADALGTLSRNLGQNEMEGAELLRINAMRQRFVDSFDDDPAAIYEDAVSLIRASAEAGRDVD